MGYEVHFKNIREKFGKPFGEIVTELAKKGHSRRGVARILGVPYTCNFARYLKSLAPEAEWRPGPQTIEFLEAKERSYNYTPDPETIERIRALGRRPKTEHYKTVRGVTGSIPMLAKHFGLSPRTVINRRRSGMSLEEALTTPVRKKEKV